MASKINCRKAFAVARLDMLGADPFFGPLAMRLEFVEDETHKTAWTDGERIGINPEFFASLDHQMRKTLIAHEVSHNAHLHPYRREGREHERWNQACDFAINQELREAGYILPTGALLDARFKGMSAEHIYTLLPPTPQGGGGGQGKGQGQGQGPGGSSFGEVRDPQADQQPKEEQEQWEQAVVSAAFKAQAAGKLPAGMRRLLERIKNPGCRDLVAALMEFAIHSAREDFSWKLPNPRFTHIPLFMPSLRSETMPPIAAAVDTSGSITADILEQFVGALQAVLDQCKPEYLRVMACDAAIHADRQHVQGDMLGHGKADFPGGGGTDFRPVFTELDKDPPTAAIYLTDLAGAFPDKAPDYPVLWVVVDPFGRRTKGPFGQTIWLDT